MGQKIHKCLECHESLSTSNGLHAINRYEKRSNNPKLKTYFFVKNDLDHLDPSGHLEHFNKMDNLDHLDHLDYLNHP